MSPKSPWSSPFERFGDKVMALSFPQSGSGLHCARNEEKRREELRIPQDLVGPGA